MATDEERLLVRIEAQMRQFERAMASAPRTADRAFRQVETRARSMQTQLASIGKGLAVGLLGGVSAAAVGRVFQQGVKGALDFNAAMSEVSTLLPRNEREMRKIETAAKGMAREFGTSRTQQAKAFYQAISAGATSAAEATELMAEANKLAVGGVTETFTAVDILTTSVNAYSKQGLTAKQASDSLFTAVRLGKTTVSELASGLGQVIPIAASLGVEFDELTAGVAALTTQGQSTAQAVTGLRSLLVAITKPSSDAAGLAKQLGIEFNTTGLRARGLSGFLQDVIEKTKGNEAQLARLFPRVEGLNAVLSFAGGAGEQFANALEEMARKAGATDEAFKKISESAEFKFRQSLNNLNEAATELGANALPLVVGVMEQLNREFEHAERFFGAVADRLRELGVLSPKAFDIPLLDKINEFSLLQNELERVELALADINREIAEFGETPPRLNWAKEFQAEVARIKQEISGLGDVSRDVAKEMEAAFVDAGKKIEAALRKVANFPGVVQFFGDLTAAMNETSEAAEKLDDRVKVTGHSLTDMARKKKEAEDAARKLGTAMSDASDDADDLSDGLDSVGSSAKKAAGDVKVLITAIRELNGLKVTGHGGSAIQSPVTSDGGTSGSLGSGGSLTNKDGTLFGGSIAGGVSGNFDAKSFHEASATISGGGSSGGGDSWGGKRITVKTQSRLASFAGGGSFETGPGPTGDRGMVRTFQNPGELNLIFNDMHKRLIEDAIATREALRRGSGPAVSAPTIHQSFNFEAPVDPRAVRQAARDGYMAGHREAHR